MPADAAAIVDGRPAAPTIAAMTTSTSASRTASTSAVRPLSTRVAKPARPERGAEFLRGLSVLEDRETRAMRDALREQPAVVRARGERVHVVTVAMARDDVERACADAARAAEYGDAGHTAQPKVIRPSTNAGAAAVRLSMRSSTPPWPGRRLPLSLRPVRRLNMLSTRSPTTEIIATTRQSPSHGRSGVPEQQRPASGSERGGEHARHETFPGLARADRGRELAATEASPAEERADVGCGRQDEEEEQQLPALRLDQHQARESDGRRREHREACERGRHVPSPVRREQEP